jgi:glycosyltransferase involved in cell wall biosynthesis
MRISIVIPTLNEEKDLPRLLQSIENQTFKDYEIIIADAGSKDKTLEIAKQYNARVVEGGMPAVGRNSGAKAANGDFLFFFDADVKLPEDFLKKAYLEMQKRYLDLATCKFNPLSEKRIDKVMHEITNLGIKIYQFTDPHAFGFCIFVSRRLFNRTRGFDESIRFMEDADFVKRASKYRSLRVLRTTSIYASIRRFEREGRFRMLMKFMQAEIYRKLKGEIRKDNIGYELGNYDKNRERLLEPKLRKLEEKLIMLNQDYKLFTKKYFRTGRLARGYPRQLNKLRERFNKVGNSFRKITHKRRQIKNEQIKSE